jgi:circadian clock protein KaiC
VSTPDDGTRPAIAKHQTNIPGLDEVLGGGLPEYSFTLIAGDPGTGKTTFANQAMFALATAERPAVHFTVLGEPPAKMLRYQQQFSFFDLDAVGERIHFVNLSEAALTGDLDEVLAAITREVERLNPGIVVVDSFRTIIRAASVDDGGLTLQTFVQRLALHLATWQATSFLVGEYSQAEQRDNPVFTIADGIVWLSQSADRNSVVRKLQVVKMRGQAPLPGLHTMRITSDGLQVFPRIIRRLPEIERARPLTRLSLGVPALDEMMGGGVPVRDSVLVAGPAGSGKSALGTAFIGAGLQAGEPGVIAVFEERPKEYIGRARAMGRDFGEALADGRLEVLYLRPLDLSVDEALLEVQGAVQRLGATRLVIDSLSGFELALAPTFRDDFRESLYRMVGALTQSGVTILMTAEIPTSFQDLIFSPNLVSFLTDDIILQRYLELEGQLRKMLTVVKMRGSDHSKALRLYDVRDDGIVIGEAFSGYEGMVTGVARRASLPLRDDAPS